MSPRTLRLLAGVLAALAAVLAGRAAWERSAARPDLLSPGAERATRVALRGPGGEVALEKGAEGWRLTRPFPFPADAAKVSAFLRALAGARLSGPLSDDPDKHALFGVDEASSTRVTLDFAGSKPLDLYVGRSGAAPDSFFLRRPGSAEVREARGMGRWEVDEKPGPWADRLVTAQDSTRVTAVRIRSLKGALLLAREGGRWRLAGRPSDLPAKTGRKIEALLTALTRLEADEVVPEYASGGAPPELALAVSALRADGQGSQTVLELSAGPVDKSFRHPVRVSGKGPVLYLMSRWRLEPFLLGPADLR